MRPSQVRGRIIRQHAALRVKLDELEAATAELQDGREGGLGAAERAVALANELCQALDEHLAVEDALLVPTLRQADAWGPVRADRLSQHHDEQREQLRSLAEQTEAGMSPQALASALAALIEDLRADMAYEEREVLSPSLLRDEVTSIEGGEDG